MLEADLSSLRQLRDKLQTALSGNWTTGDPRFYYAGSYAKHTMIRSSFDLDLVIYFPPTGRFSVKEIYELVEKRLNNRGYRTQRHNVAIRLPYQGGFHLDVVPGRAIDNTYQFANLYSPERDSTKRTSIKVHIDAVRSGGSQDVIKLVKLWRLRHQVGLGSFVIELAVARSLAGRERQALEDKVWEVLRFFQDEFRTANLIDPANSNNVVSDDVSTGVKQSVASAAATSRSKRSWQEIVW